MEKKIMLLKLPMSTKKQFKLYLEPDIVERIESAAAKSGKRSGQEVVQELISIYLPVWSTVNDSMNRAIEYQIKISAEEIAQKNFPEAKHDEPENLNKGNFLPKEKIFKESSDEDYKLLASRQEGKKKK